MKTLIKDKYILKIFETFDKSRLEVKLLAIDYKWTDEEEKNFYDIYVMADMDKIFNVRLIASGDGEMWDLELPFEPLEDIMENGKKYGLFYLNLRDKKVFPRSFVIKGVGNEEFYDNNDGRNYVVKKGRGGNIIPTKKKIILLNSIELYSLFDK